MNIHGNAYSSHFGCRKIPLRIGSVVNISSGCPALDCFPEHRLHSSARTSKMVPISGKRKLGHLTASDLLGAKRTLPIRGRRDVSGPAKTIIGVDYGTTFTGNNPPFALNRDRELTLPRHWLRIDWRPYQRHYLNPHMSRFPRAVAHWIIRKVMQPVTLYL